MLLLAYALILVGGLLCAAELVLFTHGVLAMIGLSGLIVGAILVFGENPALGVATLVALVIVLPVVARLVLNAWENSPLGRRLVLEAPAESAPVVPGINLEGLRGRYGRTLSALRPAGTTDFDGRRVDTLSEGTLVDAGSWVRCIAVREGKVIVRPVPGPPGPADLENIEIH